jgi:tetratricopeptide (TPR) repeat protein
MIEQDRVLRPLEEARSAIEKLATYESPAALQEALRATWHAVELTLRILLRSDTAAPDEVRLTALSRDDMPLDTVVAELRRRDRITLSLAGRLHELRQAVERAEAGAVRAGDADTGRDVVQRLRREITALPAQPAASGAAGDRGEPAAGSASYRAAGVAEEARASEGDPLTPAHRRLTGSLQRPVLAVAGGVMLLALVIALVLLFGRSDDMEQGITAFRAGRGGVAEQHFRAVLQRDRDNVTARLYLARILREQDRYEESANLLRDAARLAPQDAAVRRELGYLFFALNRPEQAAVQFQQSVELEPDEPLGWVGLVQSLERAGDPTAALWLSRAPAAAQAMLRTGRLP